MNQTPEASTNSTDRLMWHFGTMEKSFFAINFLLGLPTHCYVVRLVVTGPGVWAEIFTFNLSLCEILYCLNCLFSLLRLLWPALTSTSQFFMGLGITGRPVFHCLICVERFLAVVHPVMFLKLKPLRYRIFCCSVAWTITLASCLCSMFITGLFKYLEFTWFYSVQFMLFFSVQLICLASVLRALNRSGPGERARESHMKRRAFFLILFSLLSMMVTFLPIILAGLVSLLSGLNSDQHRAFGLSSFILAGFVQPVLFLHRSGKITCFRFLEKLLV